MKCDGEKEGEVLNPILLLFNQYQIIVMKRVYFILPENLCNVLQELH